MRRRTLAMALTTSVALALTSLAGTAQAAPLKTVLGNMRVCSFAALDHVACNAHVVTKNAKANATTTWGGDGYSPAQLKSAYGLTSFSGTTTVAVVDAYANPNAASDLATYRSQFGLGTANLTQYSQTGSTTLPAGDTGWGQEEMLDLEMVSAICPGCPIIYIGAKSTSFADLGAAVNEAVTKGAKVVSNSYGGTESSSETSTQSSYYTHPGVAITVSSGDDGYGVESPAAFSTVTAVGGTHLTLTASSARATETVWADAGSGCSKYISKPSWQTDSAVCAKRTVADVSADADPATGVAVYDSYGSTGGKNWYVFGGTSVAAPIIGGVYGLSGNTAGTPASLLYSHTSSLFDVTSGSNGTCSAKKKALCTGVVGYDGPSGLGTPNGSLAAF